MRGLVLWQERQTKSPWHWPFSPSLTALSLKALKLASKKKVRPWKKVQWKMSGNLIVLWKNMTLSSRKVNYTFLLQHKDQSWVLWHQLTLFPWDWSLDSYMEENSEQGECYSMHLHLRLWKNKLIYVLFSHSVVLLSAAPWTVACQASLSFTISRSLLNSCPLSRWCWSMCGTNN